MSSRPFRILGIQQIALGAPNKQSLLRLWVELLGLSVSHHFRSEAENVDEDILSVGRGLGKCEVDLMQPIDATQKPHVDEPPLNHIGLWVDDLVQAVDWLTAQGVRFAPGGIRKGASGYDICFIHPKSNAAFPVSGEGVLIELVQAPSSLITEYDDAQ